MAVNKYSQILQGPQFKARSLQEALIAPMALRQQHDATIEAAETNLKEARKAEVGPEYGDQLNEYLNDFEAKTNALINDINSSGINNNAVLDRFGSMKRKMDKDFSNQGVIGRLVNTNNKVNEANANAIKLAIDQKQSPDWASDVAKADRKKYYDSLPKSFNDINSDFEAYKPTLAPKYTDVVAEATPIFNIMGTASKELSTMGIRTDDYQIRPDANGNPQLIGYDKTTESYTRVNTDNNEQLAKAIEVLWTVQKNQNSPLMQNLRYLGHDPENLLESMRLLQGVATKVSNKEATIENTEFVPVSGGRGSTSTPSGRTKKEEEEEANGNIILLQPTAGSVTTTPVEDNIALSEILRTPAAERTPEQISTMNDLLRRKALVERSVNELITNKYYKDGKLNKGSYTDKDIKELESKSNRKLPESEINEVLGKAKDIMKKNGISEEDSTRFLTEVKNGYRELNGVSDADDFNLTGQINAVLDAAYKSMGAKGDFFTGSSVLNYLNSELYTRAKSGIRNPEAVARLLAEKDINKLGVSDNFETYNVSALNTASAMKDPKVLRSFQDNVKNIVINASGGGTIDVYNSEGKVEKKVLSDRSDRESVISDIQNSYNVSISSFDVTSNGMVMRINAEHKRENDNVSVNQYAIPIKVDEYGRLPENIDAIFDRIKSLGSRQDVDRLNTIRDIATSGLKAQPIPQDPDTMVGDNLNYNSLYPNMNLTTKQVSRNYNANGILIGDKRVSIDSTKIDSAYYPYNRSNLESIGNYITNIPGKGNYYTTRYRTKDMAKGEYKYYTFGDYLGTQMSRGELAVGKMNDATRQVANIVIMSQTMDAITSGTLTGSSPMDQMELAKIQEVISSGVSEIEAKYRRMENENASNPNYPGRKTGIFLTPSQQASKNSELNEVYSSNLTKFGKIKLAAKHKHNLL